MDRRFSKAPASCLPKVTVVPDGREALVAERYLPGGKTFLKAIPPETVGLVVDIHVETRILKVSD
jgi:hypothetical protein